MGRLKDIITSKTVYVNEKFVQAYSAPIFTNFFLLSNFELSSILEPGDRRFDVFHAAEEKLDQDRFGALADITNDGIWIERSALDNDLRKHIIYSLRTALMARNVESTFDRNESIMNSVKQVLMDSQNPPAIDWMHVNLPAFFTEDIAMMACHFCPMRITPEYVMKQLKEHFGPAMMPLYRNGRAKYRLNGSPRIERRSDGSGSTIPVLEFGVLTSDKTARKYVYTMSNTLKDANPTDAVIKSEMHRWYEKMLSQYYGNVTTLPNQKPDPNPRSDLV